MTVFLGVAVRMNVTNPGGVAVSDGSSFSVRVSGAWLLVHVLFKAVE